MGKSSVSDLSEHVFDLIQELFAIDPMLLTSVMPQLEFKLKVNTTRTTDSTRHLRSQISSSWRRVQIIDILDGVKFMSLLVVNGQTDGFPNTTVWRRVSFTSQYDHVHRHVCNKPLDNLRHF